MFGLPSPFHIGRGLTKRGAGITLPSLYLGQVATKTRIPNNLSTTNKLANARTHHIARDDITALKIELPAWYWARNTTKAEISVTGNISYRAAIEYPAGVFTQVKFGGAVSGLSTGPVPLLSDFVNVTIPKGAAFWVRTYAVATHSIVFTDASVATSGAWSCDFANGEAYEYAASGITDKTMGGELVPNKTTNDAAICFPTAIVAMTRQPSALLIGDSRMYGFGDFFNAAGDMGEFARALGPSIGYINAGSSGDSLSEFIASSTRRQALKAYCSHVIVETAINALRSSTGQNKTAAVVLAEQQTILGYFADKRCFVSTTAPSTTSANGWIDATQSLNSNAAQFTLFNDAVRAGVAGALGFFEIADVVTTARNSNKWKFDGTANKWTADGLHGTPYAYQSIQDSGAVDAARLTRAGL